MGGIRPPLPSETRGAAASAGGVFAPGADCATSHSAGRGKSSRQLQLHDIITVMYT